MSGIDDAELRKRVQAVEASRKELMFSPQGLRGLFPTNQTRVKLTTTTKKKQESRERLQKEQA